MLTRCTRPRLWQGHQEGTVCMPSGDASAYAYSLVGAMLRQPPHLQECLGYQPDQGQPIRTRDLVGHALTLSRPTPNTSQSTGKLAAVAPLLSSPSTSAAELPTSFLSSAATLLPSSTPTGMVAHGMGCKGYGANCSQVSLQRLAHLLGLRRRQSRHLEGPRKLHPMDRR